MNSEMIPCIKSDDIDQIKTSVGEINKVQAAIFASQKRIEMQILGDPEAMIEGIANKVDRHEKAIQAGQRITWIAIGIGCMVGVLWTIYTAMT